MQICAECFTVIREMEKDSSALWGFLLNTEKKIHWVPVTAKIKKRS
jgi:hypothetical protein